MTNTSGSLQQHVTGQPNHLDEDPDCGSNGLATYVVFRSTRHDSSGEIYRMDPDGSNVVRLTNNTDWDQDPAWCGVNKVVLSRYDGNDQETFIRDSSPGGVETQLTSNSGIDDILPACSPDGQFVIFSRGPNPAYTDIVQLELSTGIETNLTGPLFTYGHELNASHSPGATWIVFMHYGNVQGDAGIYKSPVVNTNPPTPPTQLTDDTHVDLEPDWGELNP